MYSNMMLEKKYTCNDVSSYSTTQQLSLNPFYSVSHSQGATPVYKCPDVCVGGLKMYPFFRTP